MIRTLGALVGVTDKAASLVRNYEERLRRSREAAAARSSTGLFRGVGRSADRAIGWVSELIEIAGGVDVFAALRRNARPGPHRRPGGRDRCGPRRDSRVLVRQESRPERIHQRPGWATIPAVRHGRIVEIKSPLILQPGPAALTDGLDAIVAALADEG